VTTPVSFDYKSLPDLSHDRPRRYAALALGFEVPPAAFSIADIEVLAGWFRALASKWTGVN
jgi:hypothetical protein